MGIDTTNYSDYAINTPHVHMAIWPWPGWPTMQSDTRAHVTMHIACAGLPSLEYVLVTQTHFVVMISKRTAQLHASTLGAHNILSTGQGCSPPLFTFSTVPANPIDRSTFLIPI